MPGPCLGGRGPHTPRLGLEDGKGEEAHEARAGLLQPSEAEDNPTVLL